MHLRKNRESDRTEYIADKRRSYILILVGLSIVTGLRHAIKLTDDNGIYLVKHIVDNTRNDQVGTISEKLTQRSHAKYPSGTPVVKHPEKNSPEKREAERLSHQRPDSHTAVSHRNGDDRSDTQRPQIDTSACLEYLERNELAAESELYVFADGAKPGSEEAVAAVRRVIAEPWKFKRLKVVERPENKGLAANVIAGVTSVLETHDRVIVLEDDLIVSPYFLRFMNEALEVYKDTEEVCHVTCHMLDHKGELPDTFLIRWCNSWGWGTWSRAWQYFEPDGRKSLREIERRDLCRQFDLDGGFHFTQMLRDQIEGRNNSWFIRWYASLFLRDKLMLGTGRSLVDNAGFDGSGTHCNTMQLCTQTLSMNPIEVVPISPVKENLLARKVYSRTYRYNYSYRHKLKVFIGNLWIRVFNRKKR